MRREDAAKLVVGPKLELDITGVEIVRLHGHEGPIPDSARTATFVATFKLDLTAAGFVLLRRCEPVKSNGGAGITLIEVTNDGNVVCPLESRDHQAELAEFLREHFDFVWELNGHASNLPRVENADTVTDNAMPQHPWICVLDPGGIRTQVFDLDCKIKRCRAVESTTGTRKIASGFLPYHIEVDADVDDMDLRGSTFRIPVTVDNLAGRAYLVFDYESRDKPALPAGTVTTTVDPPDDDEADVAVRPPRRARSSTPPNNGRTAP